VIEGRHQTKQPFEVHALRAGGGNAAATPAVARSTLPSGTRAHDFYPEFIELAGKVNQAQPAYCVERIERDLTLSQPVQPAQGCLFIGAAYKAGSGDIRSPRR